MVAIGDEGFYNKPSAATEPYQYVITAGVGHIAKTTNTTRRGHEGVDFDANLALKTIDFGTFHVRLRHPLLSPHD